MLFFSLFLNQAMATKWIYQFVVWDGYVYVISEEYVTEVEHEIGEVTKFSNSEQYSGNFSNVYKTGTKYYSIKGISTDESIAILDIYGKYKKADRGVEYTYGNDEDFLTGISNEILEDVNEEKYNTTLIFTILLVLLSIILIIFARKKTRK